MPSRWPNFFVVGVAKSATTSLHRYLGEHPDIYMAPDQETGTFSEAWDEVEDDPEGLERLTDAYLELFEGAGDEPVRGDTDPTYFWHPKAPARIAERVGTGRFLVCLRDPIERTWSQWLMGMRMDHDYEHDDILAQIEAELDRDVADRWLIRTNEYHRHLRDYFDRFGRDRVKVILLEDLKSDTLGTLQEVARFLEVDPDGMEQVDHETVHNPFGMPRNRVADWLRNSPVTQRLARALLPRSWRIYIGEHLLVEEQDKPPIDPEARELLQKVYEPQIEELEELLGRDLPELRRSWA